MIEEQPRLNSLTCALLWLRGLAPIFWLPVWTLLLAVPVLFWGAVKNWDRQTWWMSLWCRGVLWAVGVSVLADGFERLPSKGGAILVFNHQSHFDIPALTGSTRLRIRYGAKAELYQIPVFGLVLKQSGNLPIFRQSREKVMSLYRASIGTLRSGGFSYALAPEGTRQAQPLIGAFKRGPFVFAYEARAPVIPVVIEGAYDVLPKKQWLPNVGRVRRTIQVSVLSAILPSDVPKQASDAEAIEWLKSCAEARMKDRFAQLQKRRHEEGLC